MFFSRFVRTHGKLGQERHSRDTTVTPHLAGLNTGSYKSSFTPISIPREILTAQEHKVVLLNSQGLAGKDGVGERGRHQQISQLRQFNKADVTPVSAIFNLSYY